MKNYIRKVDYQKSQWEGSEPSFFINIVMKNFKDFITEKMRADPKQEQARLLARMERVRSEIPSLSPDEMKLIHSKSDSKESRIASGKLFKQMMKSSQFRDVEAALQGVEDVNIGATGKQTSVLNRGMGSKSQIRAYKTAIGKYKK